MRPSSHDEQERTAAARRPGTAAPARRGGLSTADQALLAAQHLAGNAAVAEALTPRRKQPQPAQHRPRQPADRLVLNEPAFDLQIPQGSFDHLLKGKRMRGHREILERFDRQGGVMPVAWTAGTGATAQERNTAWRVHQRTLVATSTLRQFTAVSADAPDLAVGGVTAAGALLAGLPRGPRLGGGSLRLRYAGERVVGGAARVTSRTPDEATLVVEMAFAQGTLVMTGRRDAQGDHLDWDTELTIDLDALARVLWRDVFDRLETRRKGGVKKLKPAAAAGDPPKKTRRIEAGDDDTDRTEPSTGTGEDQRMTDERA